MVDKKIGFNGWQIKLGSVVDKKIGFDGWQENWVQWLARKLVSMVGKKIGYNG